MKINNLKEMRFPCLDRNPIIDSHFVDELKSRNTNARSNQIKDSGLEKKIILRPRRENVRLVFILFIFHARHARMKINNLKEMRFPCLGRNPIIDSHIVDELKSSNTNARSNQKKRIINKQIKQNNFPINSLRLCHFY